MNSEPAILAFDTSAAHCAAAVFAGGAVRQAIVEPMAKGQAERILGLCEEVLAALNLSYQDLTALAVGVGPGNFTGIRISVSAARGLALGLGIPAIPVSAFEMLRDPFGPAANAAELVVVEAPRGAAYAQQFRYGRPTDTPMMIDPEAPPRELQQDNMMVTGFRAEEIAKHFGATAHLPEIHNPAEQLVRMALWKLAAKHDIDTRPAPLYVRAPDAAPARDTPPKILT
ncbi:tRNA (adenosine(37)-N6)-threonylcarbamoyltransferase complex dimerization subunit type 1 TsaB [Sulfitobacter noctilucae]|uniref:tRNA (adenosine(37)-N6)-threonylcarbamoyltransferase complex dimerization subunit type 1 TsaB n=1 Tax=Sulfitobacter noctilucae TaxID=1342302 RepID=UPI00046AB1E7|nr:tRNA (adenosine(37)-N6)-threonylcarbamoyltransferase complex dimerization subunit type 1 TsaB [Sulfitobacter noctilucae]